MANSAKLSAAANSMNTSSWLSRPIVCVESVVTVSVVVSPVRVEVLVVVPVKL